MRCPEVEIRNGDVGGDTVYVSEVNWPTSCSPMLREITVLAGRDRRKNA